MKNGMTASKATPSFWLDEKPLILASGSATRVNMLQSAGLKPDIIKPDVDERAIERPLHARGATAAEVSGELAKAKAVAISVLHPGRWVLGADQTLDCKGEFLHKSATLAAARHQLMKLSGQMHCLTSAAALVCDGEIHAVCVSTARLNMRQLNSDMVDTYLEKTGNSILASVGGYQLENLGVHLFEKIEGDHFTILGLPLLQLLADMRRLGLVAT